MSLVDRSLTLPVKPIGLINNVSYFTEGNTLNFSHIENTLLLNLTVPLFYQTVFLVGQWITLLH